MIDLPLKFFKIIFLESVFHAQIDDQIRTEKNDPYQTDS